MLKKSRFVYMILAATLLLAGCIPATEGATLDPTQAAALVSTAVAQALDAQATQIAASIPQATATLVVTTTPIPAPATATLFPTITPIVLPPTVAPSGGGSTYTKPALACDPDIGKRPYDNSGYKPGDTFDIKFTIVNTGTEKWEYAYDLSFNGGKDLTNGGFTTIQVPALAPGERFSVGPYDAWAPGEKGSHVMQFKLQGGFCYPYVAIIVE